MMHRTSKPVRPSEGLVGGVRFSCPTERSTGIERQQAESTGRRGVSTKVTLEDLAWWADDAGLFCNSTPEPNTGCYLWEGRTTKQGYGVVCIERKTVTAHRAVYRLCVEDINDSLDVHHICEQPSCIYPEHLIALTPLQHRRVHAGLARAHLVFDQRYRPDPFDLGFLGYRAGVLARRGDL